MTVTRPSTPTWALLLLGAAAIAVVWILAQTLGHVLIIFMVSMTLALLLNPLVRILRRLHIPRGLAVLMVFVTFIGTLTGAVALVIEPVRAQVEEIQQNLPVYTDQANRQVDRLQTVFDDRGIDVNVKKSLGQAIDGLQQRAGEAADNVLSYSLDLIGALVTLIIIIVCTVYMLLDAPRILRTARTLGGDRAAAFLRRTERTLTEYIKAQVLVSLIIGTSAGVVLWLLGVTGIFPLGATFTVAFVAWVFLMEFVPYVGPILGAVPPLVLALVTSPLAAVWVIVAFVAIHQIEGHIVVPKIMGSAVGVPPLVVIFGLLVGEQLAGLVGVLIALPIVVVVKEAVTFAGELLGVGRVAEVVDPEVPVTEDPPQAEVAAPTTREYPAAPVLPISGPDRG
jgi:predicted PurR-regulated permease PerM